MKKRALISVFLVFLLFALLFSSPQPVSAGLGIITFEVDTTDDFFDEAPNQICAEVIAPGPIYGDKCSLRAALNEAGADHVVENKSFHIKLPPDTYTLTLTSIDPLHVDGRYNDLDIPALNPGSPKNWVLIEGTGGPDNPSIINANGIDRVLEIGKGREVILRNLMFVYGEAIVHENSDPGGGAILMNEDSNVTLENVSFYANEAFCVPTWPCTGSKGGAIHSKNANLIINHAEFSYNEATLGSAIYFEDSSPNRDKYQFNVLSSSFFQNAVKLGSSAVIAGSGRLFLINSTMADNQTSGPHIGCGNISLDGDIWVEYSTLINHYPAFNILYGGGHSVNIRNSILYNRAPGATKICKGDAVGGPIISKGGNVFGDSSCLPKPTIGDLVLPYDQAKLDTLAFNGGYSPTIALMEGSPAINRSRGACKYSIYEPALGRITEYVLLVDQRGFPRDDGWCDAGAFEAAFPFSELFLPMARR